MVVPRMKAGVDVRVTSERSVVPHHPPAIAYTRLAESPTKMYRGSRGRHLIKCYARTAQPSGYKGAKGANPSSSLQDWELVNEQPASMSPLPAES